MSWELESAAKTELLGDGGGGARRGIGENGSGAGLTGSVLWSGSRRRCLLIRAGSAAGSRAVHQLEGGAWYNYLRPGHRRDGRHRWLSYGERLVPEGASGAGRTPE